MRFPAVQYTRNSELFLYLCGKRFTFPAPFDDTPACQRDGGDIAGGRELLKKVVFIFHPPLNPPASGGKYFCICIRYTRSIHLRREKTTFSLPARGEGWGGGFLFATSFSIVTRCPFTAVSLHRGFA